MDHAVKVAEEVHNTAEEPVAIQHRLAEVKAAPDHLTTRVPATQKDAQVKPFMRLIIMTQQCSHLNP